MTDVRDATRLRRLLLVATGSESVQALPRWVDRLRGQRPELELELVVTRGAERFVPVVALRSRSVPVHHDDWPEAGRPGRPARWAEWAEWADAFVVYPAALDFVARLALGLVDTPALLAAQRTSRPLLLAPEPPAGGLASAAHRRHYDELLQQPNVVVVPPVEVRRGEATEWSVAPMAEVLAVADEHHVLLAVPDQRDGPAAHPVPVDTLADGDPTSGRAPGADREFGTGLLHTVVRDAPDGGGWLWVRRPGPQAPRPFTGQPTVTGGEQGCGALAAGVARLVPGTEVDGEPGIRRYRVDGSESLACRLLREGPTPALEPALRAVGALLRVLHCRPGDVCPSGPTGPVLRMREWFAGRAPRPTADRAGQLLRARIGNVRWTRLATWAVAAEPTAADPAVALHGAPGLGSIVVDPDSGRVALLGGEDAGLGPWQHDIGWMLGELVEMRWWAGGDEDEQERWSTLYAAVVEGYGADVGFAAHRWTALRVALHLHDFSAYVGWHPDELERYAPFLAALVDG